MCPIPHTFLSHLPSSAYPATRLPAHGAAAGPAHPPVSECDRGSARGTCVVVRGPGREEQRSSRRCRVLRRRHMHGGGCI